MTHDSSSSADDLCFRSATTLAELIRFGEVSAGEVVEAHLRRIEAVNSGINAVVQLDADRAREAARAADALVRRGGSLPVLHGVPFTAKDNLETDGVVTAIGVPERAAVVPTRDATVVARMKAAGAILLGKTNCPAWGGGSETVNELYGRTRNPYDRDRSVSGSSGGEAAIIAAGGSPMGLGTDSGGSVRDPAHFCGLAALKPTAGLIPVTGVLDDVGQPGMVSDLRTQVGPIARSVTDIVVITSVLAGPDGVDAGCVPMPFRDPASVSVEGLRVAVQLDNPLAPPSPDTVATIRAAAAVLSASGAVVEEAAHPQDGHLLTREIWESYEPGVSSLDLYRVLRRWDDFRSRMLRWLADWDVVLSPVYPTAAHLHDAPVPAGLSYTTPYSLTGWPCAIVRCGTSPDGLPIGAQVVAGPWRDHVALAVAAVLEGALGGFRPPPL
ncbi:MAG TPA: amidase [Candidatus Limnocylindrales bacterium]|nr:amidase [Candidatus Limnocylindrales bacterium]